MSASRSLDEAVDEVVEQLGFGLQQILVLVAGGCSYASTTAVTIGVAQASRAVVWEAGVERKYQGVLTSILFGGYILGNLLSGPLADRCGRRLPHIVAFAGLSLCLAFAATLGWSTIVLLGTCFFGCGTFMGLALASANTNMKEWTVARLRPTLFCMLFVFLASGQIGAGIFFSITSPNLTKGHLQWRLYLSLLSMIFLSLSLLCMLLLPESAQWMLTHNMHGEARKGLLDAAARNGVSLDEAKLDEVFKAHGVNARELEESTPLNADAEHSQSIFAGHLIRTTCIMCCANVVANACYYGLMCTLSSTLSDTFEGTDILAADVILVLTLFELPGIALQNVLGQNLSRQVNLSAVFVAVAISLGCLAFSLKLRSSDAWVFLIAASVLAKLTIIACFIITYLSMSEAYPISCRATGNGFCMSIGRIGALISPMLFAELGDFTFYTILSVAALISAVASLFLEL